RHRHSQSPIPSTTVCHLAFTPSHHHVMTRSLPPLPFFFFNDPPPTEIYTLSLHDALPISSAMISGRRPCPSPGIEPRSAPATQSDRKSTRLNSSHVKISYAVFCLKKKKRKPTSVRYIVTA